MFHFSIFKLTDDISSNKFMLCQQPSLYLYIQTLILLYDIIKLS
jgi:hypothetical protein